VAVVIPTRGTKLPSLARAVRSVWRQLDPDDDSATLGHSSLAEPIHLEVEVVVVVDGPAAPPLPTENTFTPTVSPSSATSGPAVKSEVETEVETEAGTDEAEEEAAAIRAALSDRRVRVVRLASASGGRPGLVRNAGLGHCQDCDWVRAPSPLVLPFTSVLFQFY
jgi:hypothetical protein